LTGSVFPALSTAKNSMVLVCVSCPGTTRLRAALTAITHHVDDYADRARRPRPRVKPDPNVHKLAVKDRPADAPRCG